MKGALQWSDTPVCLPYFSEVLIAGYKTEQRYIVHRGTVHHFVSYEGASANIKKSLAATAPAWCLMRAGKRWAVMEQVMGQSEEELDQQLLRWLEQQDFPPDTAMATVDAGNTSRWDRRWPGPKR